jgi:glycosyltransferase involved in cell wall biosynthesis
MRIAFFCKRQYMGKDVILDRYARLYEIPRQLARLGHVVRGFCLSYQGHLAGQWTHAVDSDSGRLDWASYPLGRLILPGLLTYFTRVLRELRQFQPEVLIGASDIPHAILTQRLAARLGIPYAIDLYDNFEGFGQARIPGMVAALRNAVRQAVLVTTTSDLLKELVEKEYRAKGRVLSMPSTIDKRIFYPQDKSACRQALNLPPDALLVGTAGGLHQDKGIGVLYEAWPRIAEKYPGARLVLAGQADKVFPPPQRNDVIYLGSLPHARTADLFNALDIGVIYLRNTVFGRYCFPQKAYEMMACRLPIVAADVGVMANLLAAPACLYMADNADSLAKTLVANIASPRIAENEIHDWEHIVRSMNENMLISMETQNVRMDRHL